MAIENKLSVDKNEYRYEFENAYFKVENVFIDTKCNIVRIHVRAYSCKEAREKQREYENKRKKLMALLFNGKKLEKAFKDQDKYRNIEDFRIYLEQEVNKVDKNVIGIFKDVIEVSFEDFGIDRDALLKMAYKVIKSKDIFRGGKDV